MKMVIYFVQKSCNLRNDLTLQRRRNHTVYFGTESMSSLAPKIWEIVPCKIKNTNSLDNFKERINWKTNKAPRRLCR